MGFLLVELCLVELCLIELRSVELWFMGLAPRRRDVRNPLSFIPPRPVRAGNSSQLPPGVRDYRQ